MSISNFASSSNSNSSTDEQNQSDIYNCKHSDADCQLMKMFCGCKKVFSGVAAPFMLLLLCAICGVCAGDTWPSEIKRCRMEDEACIINQGQTLLKLARNGIPDRNVPSIDPMDLGTMRINSGGQSDSLQFNLLLTDTKLYNFANAAVIKSLKGFVKNPTKPLKLSWVISSSDVEMRAKYEVNGKVLILPIVSKGDVTINMGNILAKTRIIAEPEKRADGHTYLKITDYKTVAKVTSGSFNMSNLFENNVELRESTLKILNDEWDTLAVTIKPKLLNALDHGFWKALQALWENVPYDEFFEKE